MAVVRRGWLQVICGCMFAGKTEVLLRSLRRAEVAGARILVVRPGTDTRSDEQVVRSRATDSFPCQMAAGSADIIALAVAAKADVVAIDEAQFFDAGLPAVVERLVASFHHVIIAGLDTDFRGRPFGSMPDLLACADEVTKLTAICMVCGEDATRTQRLINGLPAPASSDTIAVSGLEDVDSYEARCRDHHTVPGLIG